MRLTPELWDAIESARGEVQRTTYVEGAIYQRLRAEGHVQGSEGTVSATGVNLPAPAADPIRDPLDQPESGRSPEDPTDEYVRQEVDEFIQTSLPPVERSYPPRPVPRTTGGRKRR